MRPCTYGKLEKFFLEFIWKIKMPRVAKTILSKENVGELISHSVLYNNLFKTVVMLTVCYQ